MGETNCELFKLLLFGVFCLYVFQTRTHDFFCEVGRGNDEARLHSLLYNMLFLPV